MSTSTTSGDDVPLDATDLVPGTRYRFALTDCCVAANLVAEFRSLGVDPDDGEPDERVYLLDIGIVSGARAYPIQHRGSRTEVPTTIDN